MNEECCDREVYSILLSSNKEYLKWLYVCKYEVIHTKTLIESNAFLNAEL